MLDLTREEFQMAAASALFWLVVIAAAVLSTRSGPRFFLPAEADVAAHFRRTAEPDALPTGRVAGESPSDSRLTSGVQEGR